MKLLFILFYAIFILTINNINLISKIFSKNEKKGTTSILVFRLPFLVNLQINGLTFILKWWFGNKEEYKYILYSEYNPHLVIVRTRHKRLEYTLILWNISKYLT